MRVQRLRHDLPCDQCGRLTTGTTSLYKNTLKPVLCFKCDVEGGHPSGAGLGIDWVE